MNHLFKIALACGLAAALSSCSRTDGSAESKAPTAETVTIVPVTKVARTDLSGDLILTAEFSPFQEVDVMAKVSGYVSEISVDMGDRVRDGQVLATLEIPEMEDDLKRSNANIKQSDAQIAAASDELQRAQSARDLAHLSYSRIADVLKREPGLVPQQEVDEAHSRDLIADSQVAAAQSNLQVAQQRAQVARAELGRVKTLRNYTTITAPFAGVITKRYANKGSMIQAGTASQLQAMPVVRLSQNNLLRLTVPVPESSVSRIRVGETLDVRVPSMGPTGSTFPGRVARFSDKVQSSTRTMDTEVDVPNPQLTLIPGMYAEVTLRVEDKKNTLAVPLDAVERGAGEARVYIVTEAGSIHIVPVKLGLETAQQVEVLSGLEERATIVIGRHAGLREGQRVQPRFAEAAH